MKSTEFSSPQRKPESGSSILKSWLPEPIHADWVSVIQAAEVLPLIEGKLVTWRSKKKTLLAGVVQKRS